jgi:uncharacterized protein YggE
MPVSPQAMMAAVIAEIEATGIDRRDITPTMIQNILKRMNNEPRVLEGEVG